MPEGSGSSTGTNSERWLHEHQWQSEEVPCVAAATPVDLGAPPTHTLRIREITIRHAGTNNTIVTLIVGGVTLLSIDVPAQSTVTWSSQDGRKVAAGGQPTVQTSDVTGGSTFVSAVGTEG